VLEEPCAGAGAGAGSVSLLLPHVTYAPRHLMLRLLRQGGGSVVAAAASAGGGALGDVHCSAECGVALSHPAFWGVDKAFDFLATVGNLAEVAQDLPVCKTAFPPLAAALAAAGYASKSGEWEVLPELWEHVTAASHRFQYDRKSVAHLLRFVRNCSDISGHWSQLPEAFRTGGGFACAATDGVRPDIAQYFVRTFFWLPSVVWQVALDMGWHTRRPLRQYFVAGDCC
jgi:hypothetical protein